MGEDPGGVEIVNEGKRRKLEEGSRLPWRVLDAAVILVGLLAVLWGTVLAGLSVTYLQLVNPSVGGHGVTTLGAAIDTRWVVTVALAAIGIVACAGLPSTRAGAR